jgi:geranylgeranyl diphosphate synthase, type I
MSLNSYFKMMRPAIEDELQKDLAQSIPKGFEELKAMMAYHMGWEGEGAGLEAQGKRIRPILLLLCVAACEKEWRIGLPAAAAIEYVHNFSLIHDDIQDQSELRRGRETVWKKWGVAQAINGGDFMFTMAHLAMLRLSSSVSTEITIQAARILHHTAIQLTKGQFLDMSYEKQITVPLEAYWPMNGGKTAALLGCCCEIGALISGMSENDCENFRDFGYSLGLAFQVQDDWLGIWGDSAQIGKSTDSDLITRKKTLPILFALEKGEKFSERWYNNAPILKSEVTDLANLLAEEGAKAFCEKTSLDLTEKALSHLSSTSNRNDAFNALRELAGQLTDRKQ